MAFSATNRVRFTDQSSQWRGKSGTVMVVDNDGNHIRLDGAAANGPTVLAKDDEIQLTSFESPVTYA
jgi:hypothetical protein